MNSQRVDAIGLISTVLLLAACYFGLFRRGTAEHSQIELQAAQMRQTAREHHGLLAEVDRAQTLVQPLREAARDARTSLAQPGDIDKFLRRLATTAREANVEMNLLRPGAATSDKNSDYLPIEVVAVGLFPQLHQFFNELEKCGQLAIVEELSITSNVREAPCKATFTIHLHLPSGGKS